MDFISKHSFDVSVYRAENGFVVKCGYGEQFNTCGSYGDEKSYIAKNMQEANKIRDKLIRYVNKQAV